MSRAFVLPCTVLDHSASGARLSFDRPIYLRGAQELCVDNLFALPFRTVWRSEHEMGISFEAAAPGG